MKLIDLGADAPHHPLATAGNPSLKISMFKIRVFG
jgi:hypothetical protein